MSAETTSPETDRPVLTPLRLTVLPEWIDYNGHMNLAYYVLAFDKGSDVLLDHLGLGAAYRRETNHSLYVLEAHLTYDQEVKLGDPLLIETQLVDADAKRLHIFHRMRHADQGFLAATTELMALHVDLAGPQAAPFPASAQAGVGALLAEHRRLPPPPQLGRSISIKRRG